MAALGRSQERARERRGRNESEWERCGAARGVVQGDEGVRQAGRRWPDACVRAAGTRPCPPGGRWRTTGIASRLGRLEELGRQLGCQAGKAR